MEDKIYLNKQVSEIVGITQRQVLSWTEKGLIVPLIESTGVGTKRGYGYTNLLEFGLCKKLFSFGFGFRAAKKMLNDMRNTGTIRDWASDFKRYYSELFKKQRSILNKQIKEMESIGNIKTAEFLKKSIKKYFPESGCTDKSTGVLIYFFTEGEDYSLITPWDIDTVINSNMIKGAFDYSDSVILIDICKIKKMVDNKR